MAFLSLPCGFNFIFYSVHFLIQLNLNYSDLLKDHGTNVMEPSPTSVLDGFEGNPKILHQLVSEGDLDGIR